MSATAVPTLHPVSPAEIAEEIEPVEGHEDEAAYAERVEQTLGHTALRERIEEQTLPNQRLSLLSILREHGFKLYRTEDVSLYKQTKIDEVTLSLDKRKEGLRRLTTMMVVIIIVDVIVNWIAHVPLLPFLTPYAGLLLVLCVRANVAFKKDMIDAKWQRYSLSEYPNIIPKPVTDLAMRLQAAAPNVGFAVEEFVVEKRPLDPLLFVQLGSAEYCIAVWDEPDFHAKLVE